MTDISIISMEDKLQDLELSSNSQQKQEQGSYGKELIEAILCEDQFKEIEVLKSLGDLHLERAKLSKDSAEFDKTAGLYAAALLRCTDSNMGQTLEHCIDNMEKLSRRLLQGHSPHFLWLQQDYWGTAESSVSRVAEICDKLDRGVGKSLSTIEQTYTETLVTAIANSDLFLELECLKSLGDFYLEKGRKTHNVHVTHVQFSKATAMYNRALRRCGDPQTKETLQHRIKYTEKAKEEVRRRQWRAHMGHQRRNITRTNQDHLLHPSIREATDPRMTNIQSELIEEERTIERQVMF
ncbi:uncharacterized protein LOC144876879 [Branchiostoma floridae x Branchiostoma japonicum]